MFQTLLYYKYTTIEDTELFSAQHLAFCKSLELKGRILVAEEGINGTVSGSAEACKKYMETLQNDVRFEGIEFKIDESETPSFDKMHVRVKEELVHLDKHQHQLNPNEFTAPHISPEEVLELKDQPDVVMLDVRNKVEHELGKFKDAITLDIDTFREFPEKISEIEDLKDKTVIAYCTGGIRCEKATALMMQSGFENLYQIDGGIIKYGKVTGGKDFEGECYVFDKRISVPVNSVNPKVISTCRICDEKSTKFVNCSNPECNEHFVLCDLCGWKMEGACSETCQSHPRRRPYDGTGYYARGGA